MQALVEKYARKIVAAGLVAPGAVRMAGLDADLVWNVRDSVCDTLEPLFDGLNINSLLFAPPREPYASIIAYLARQTGDAIRPADCETRTMMHDLPVVDAMETGAIMSALKQRKSVIVRDRGIVTWGTVSPEQAFIFYSSTCFACFVKFFSDYLAAVRQGMVSREQRAVLEAVLPSIEPLPVEAPVLAKGPFEAEETVYRALIEAGRKTVEYRLVDSFFGNISYRFGNTLYISQTGSSLDELEGCIDPCPLDGSSCAGITASSEFTAHRETVLGTGMNAILHGHPRFSVILSMDCEREGCEQQGECHRRCPEARFVEDIPVVPGEVGTGPFGLCNTLPPAMVDRRGVLVYGHGLFTVARDDFNAAFSTLLEVERQCRATVLSRAGVKA